MKRSTNVFLFLLDCVLQGSPLLMKFFHNGIHTTSSTFVGYLAYSGVIVINRRWKDPSTNVYDVARIVITSSLPTILTTSTLTSSLKNDCACYGNDPTIDSIMPNCTDNNGLIAIDSLYRAVKQTSSGCPQTASAGIRDEVNCCTYNVADDCQILGSYTDPTLSDVYNDCAGVTSCTKQVTWQDTSSDCTSGVYLTQTNYMCIEYYCFSIFDTATFCDGLLTTYTGDELYVYNDNYPAAISHTGCCSCRITASSPIDVNSINFQLYDAATTCEQLLKIEDGGVLTTYDCTSNNDFRIQLLMTSTTNEITVTLENNAGTASGYMWLGFVALSGQLSMECGTVAQCPSTTPPTTTTTTPPTTTTTTPPTTITTTPPTTTTTTPPTTTTTTPPTTTTTSPPTTTTTPPTTTTTSPPTTTTTPPTTTTTTPPTTTTTTPPTTTTTTTPPTTTTTTPPTTTTTTPPTTTTTTPPTTTTTTPPTTTTTTPPTTTTTTPPTTTTTTPPTTTTTTPPTTTTTTPPTTTTTTPPTTTTTTPPTTTTTTPPTTTTTTPPTTTTTTPPTTTTTTPPTTTTTTTTTTSTTTAKSSKDTLLFGLPVLESVLILAGAILIFLLIVGIVGCCMGYVVGKYKGYSVEGTEKTRKSNIDNKEPESYKQVTDNDNSTKSDRRNEKYRQRVYSPPIIDPYNKAPVSRVSVQEPRGYDVSGNTSFGYKQFGNNGRGGMPRVVL